MPRRAFFAFMLPSLAAMLIFIALPIVSVAVQSFYTQHEQVLLKSQFCTPYSGCTTGVRVDSEATEKRRAAQPLGHFNGFGTYLDRNHLAVADIRAALHTSDGAGTFFNRLYALPFYKALSFTLVYTFVVTPLAMLLGFATALAINTIRPKAKGFVIFFSLLPMIITPLIGALILYWMINPLGILGATLQAITGDPQLALSSSAPLTWLALLTYGVWTNAPFSFIVFYAGLQTVPLDTLEATMIDGASRWQRIRYVVIPHLWSLATFIALVQLMDNFRVFEPVVGMSAQANATSLSWNVFHDLQGQADQQFGSAAATSVLTIIGVMILLMPVLVRTWRDFNRK
ncbi:sugar ABC transporter permease [Paraburkholderia sp. J12]|uniref:carbohydrate ABC transporter permease n=1 Tax=Paraburkholderia sp. J12 TaxID=2805432 RepID=UPI002ABE850B|nr:sugar ABC transporter permease [Paraburkholderia sp. J12]